MHLLCPHCHNAIELVEVSPAAAEVLCPSCGSSIRLGEPASTTDWAGALESTKIGTFELQERLGVGHFGAVYKAHDAQLDRTVAVKIPRPGNIETTQAGLDRFIREARSVAQLRHPGIVPVHEVGTEDGRPYIVSEFVAGITLADFCTARKLTFRQAAELVAQLADALQYAHDHGVVHRDVKPSNIMLEEPTRGHGDAETRREEGLDSPRLRVAASPLPRLMDFGLAKRDAGEITMTVEGQVLGTPAYMSPEQARGEAHRVDGRSDEYSLGVIFYELLTGELPFHGNTRMLLYQVLHDEPAPLRRLNDRIPRDLETICLKALAKEPARRYPSCGELAADLRRWLKDEPIQARPVSRLEKAWRWCRRKPLVASLTAAVSLLLLVLSVGASWAAVRFQHLADAEGRARQTADNARQRTKQLTLLVAQEVLRKLENERLAQATDSSTPAPRSADWSKPAEGKGSVPLPAELAQLRTLILEAHTRKNEDEEFSLLLKATNELVELGYYAEAKTDAERMVELSATKESRVAIAYGQLGLAQYRLGLAEPAVASYEAALKHYRDYYEKMTRLRSSSKVQEAQIDDYLSHLARLAGVTLMRIGNVHKAVKNYAKASAAYTQAHELFERHNRKAELVTLSLNLGSLQSNSGEHAQALATLQQGLALARELGKREEEASLLINLANAQARAGSNVDALRTFQTASALLPPSTSSEERRALLANWISALIEEDQLEDAAKLVPELRQIVRPDQDAEWHLALRLLEACLGRRE